jgi:predicted transcriptional regulator
VDTEEEETTLIAMTMKDLALQRDAVRRLLILRRISLERSAALRLACMRDLQYL